MSVSEDMLMAYADGELDAADRERVDAALAADPALADRLTRHRLLRSSLGAHYAPVMEEPVPERLLAAARAGEAKVVDLSAFRARRSWLAPAAMAACLAAGLFIGVGLPRDADPLTARGDLATALDKQLASAPGEGAIRVGLTFKATDDRYCRTYSTADQAGVACRDGGDWKLRMVMAQDAAATGGYRTASAQTPAPVLAAVESMIAGAPLDAEAEAKAREAGWR